MARRNVDYLFRVAKDDVTGRFQSLERQERRFHRGSGRNWDTYDRRAKRSFSGIGRHARAEFGAMEAAAAGLTGKLISALSGAAIAAAVNKNLTNLANLGDQMTGIAIKLRRPVESLESVRRELLAFSQQPGITSSADDMARSVNTLVGADFDLASAMQITKASAKATSATLTDTSVVTGGLTSVLKGFRIEAGRSEEVLSKMIRATDLGVVEMGDLSGAMVDLVAPSIQVGASIEEVLALLETLSISGVSNAAEASTSIARMLERFGSSEFRKKARGLGIQVVDERGNLKSPLEILDLIRKKYNSLNNDIARSKFLEKITGGEIRAKRALVPLLKNLEQVKTAFEDISHSGDRLDEAFAEAQKGLSKKLALFKNMVMDVGMAVTESLVPAIEKAATLWSEAFPAEKGGFAQKIRDRNARDKEMLWGEFFFERSPLGILAKTIALMNQERIGPLPPELAFPGGGAIQRAPQTHPVLLQPKIEIKNQIDAATGKTWTDVTVSNPNEWERRIPLQP